MRWKWIVLYGLGGMASTLFLLAWLTTTGIFDPPKSPPTLTAEKRSVLHADTVAGFDAFSEYDHNGALALWLPRARADDADAQFWLARMYDHGHGVQASDQIAIDWYRRSANHGNPSAMHNLAIKISQYDGVRRDPHAAFELWKQAAEMGVARAQYSLARAFLNGSGVAADPFTAVHWYERAAEQGHVWALGMLAVGYFRGHGTERDLTRAFEYNYIAKELGNSRAAIAHPIYFLWTTREQKKRAKRRADAWLKRFRGSGKVVIR